MATLREIAELAQVDTSIVSRVLHKRDYRRASAATRERIEQAARDLGYEPNVLARSLVRRKTEMAALMIPDLHEPVFVRYLETIDELLEGHGIQVLPLLSRWSDEREGRLLRLIRQRRVDGLISLFYNPALAELYAGMVQSGIPTVFRNLNEEPLPSVDQVQVDIVEGARILCHHLWSNGYSRIALLGGFAAEQIATGRHPDGLASGYVRAHSEAGRAIDPRLAIRCRDDGLDAAERLLQHLDCHPESFDAILVQSNSKLPGLYHALGARGLRIGADIGVVTLTDSQFCQIGNVPITTWEQPVAEICNALVNALLRRFSDNNAAPTALSFTSQLIVRQSSAGKSTGTSS